MENSPDLHPSEGKGSTLGPEILKPVEEQQASLHATDPPLPPSPTTGPDSCLTDMDCPVCFCRYGIYRVPKELSCKHNFCAVCLKLLVRNEVGTWRVVCPVCREPTPVFGGLVCTLQNQESLMSRLENPKPRAEVLEPPVRLDGHGLGWERGDVERHGNLTIAARRLVILLLILLILLIIILQFVYTGIMKWVLGFILGVVVIITVLLCFNPNCRMSLPRADGHQKDNEAEAGV